MPYCQQCGTLITPAAREIGRCPFCQTPLFSATFDDDEMPPALPDFDETSKEQSFYYPGAASPSYQDYNSSPYALPDREPPPPPPRRRRRLIALGCALAAVLIASALVLAVSAPPGKGSAVIIPTNTSVATATLTTAIATSGSGVTATTTLPTATALVTTTAQPQPTATHLPSTSPTMTPTPALTATTTAQAAKMLITPARYRPPNTCFGASTTFQLANIGDASLNWVASPSDSIVNVFPSSGTLAANASVVVRVTGLTGTSASYVITIADPRATNSPQTFTIQCP